MNLLPFWTTIFWKSWSSRAAALGGICAAACGSMHAFDTLYPSHAGDLTEYGLAAAGAFFGLVVAPTLRVISQNFGTDTAGNQIVSAIGVAPAGASPTPPVVVAAPPGTTKQTSALPQGAAP